jgi:uncharacterized membrane protein
MGANVQNERFENDIERSFQCQILGEAMIDAAQFEKNENRNKLIAVVLVAIFAVVFVWSIYNSKFEIQNYLWSIIILLVYIMYRLYILEQLMIKTLLATKSK